MFQMRWNHQLVNFGSVRFCFTLYQFINGKALRPQYLLNANGWEVRKSQKTITRNPEESSLVVGKLWVEAPPTSLHVVYIYIYYFLHIHIVSLHIYLLCMCIYSLCLFANRSASGTKSQSCVVQKSEMLTLLNLVGVGFHVKHRNQEGEQELQVVLSSRCTPEN